MIKLYLKFLVWLCWCLVCFCLFPFIMCTFSESMLETDINSTSKVENVSGQLRIYVADTQRPTSTVIQRCAEKSPNNYRQYSLLQLSFVTAHTIYLCVTSSESEQQLGQQLPLHITITLKQYINMHSVGYSELCTKSDVLIAELYISSPYRQKHVCTIINGYYIAWYPCIGKIIHCSIDQIGQCSVGSHTQHSIQSVVITAIAEYCLSQILQSSAVVNNKL